jgi:hypothetical protein
MIFFAFLFHKGGYVRLLGEKLCFAGPQDDSIEDANNDLADPPIGVDHSQ